MQTRTFPKIPGEPVSILGFGCMRLPTIGGDMARIDEERAAALVARAIDRGVNYVDTAYPYHAGTSEAFVGRALAGGLRDRVRLATKSPVWLVEKEKDWERLLDEQLRRLQTDHVDFYLLHALSGERWQKVLDLGGLAAMERARADGRIRHLGFSFHGSQNEFRTILGGYDDWEFCQIQLNYVDQEFQAGLPGLRAAAERGIGVVVMEPLRGGSLAKAPPEVEAIFARGPARSAAEWGLRWLFNLPEVKVVLSGMNDDAQLDENLAVARDARAGAMGPDELSLIEEARAFYAARTKVPCTTCGYCQPCPNGVAIPDTFWLYNAGAVFGTKASSGAWYRSQYVAHGAGGDACVACGECEPKCPQGIKISDRLKEAHSYLTSD